jgi:hypothetical protein
MKLKVLKEGKWIHASKEDLEDTHNSLYLSKGLKVLINNEWKLVESMIKDSGNNDFK